MAKITIDKNRCKGCLLCMSFCPKGLIKVSQNLNKQGINPVESKGTDECIACCQCAIICPDCCIEVYK